MTHTHSLFKLLLISITFSINVSTTIVTMECLENCNINPIPNSTTKSGVVNGEEGKTITLKYNINGTFLSLNLEYDTFLIGVVDLTSITTQQPPNNPLFDFGDTTLVKVVDIYSFTFKVINLNRNAHNGKTFLSKYQYRFVKEDLSLTINVQYGPKVIGGWISNYNVNEGDDLKLNLTLSGNPTPTVTATMGGQNRQVNTPIHLNASTLYTVPLQNIGKADCGKTVTLKGIGYASLEVNVSAMINVVFTPEVPAITSGVFNLTNCLIVAWNKIESGDCAASYTLKYEYVNGTETNKTNTETYTVTNTRYQKCFNSSHNNGTVSIQAAVGGRSSTFSAPMDVSVHEETISTTPGTTTGASTTVASPDTGATTGSDPDEFKWYYILIIVIGAIIIIVIIICIVLVITGRLACYSCTCCKKDVKTKPAAPESGIPNPHYMSSTLGGSVEGLTRCMTGDYATPTTKESEYAEVNNVQPAQPQPMDYAELGPGGRAGEKPKIQPSFYAQVNTDEAYYPPLNPETRVPPEYAVASKPRSSPVDQPVYAQSTKMKTIRPPGEYDEGDVETIRPPIDYEDGSITV